MTATSRYVTLIALLTAAALSAWAISRPPAWRTIASYRTGLSERSSAQNHNVRLSMKSIDGRVIQPGAVFSFNKTVGSWTSDRGYVKAPVSYDGELIPSWGGGVCQTSSTLYNAALLAGMEIVERHRHQFPARYVAVGQDAAVAQYNIDFKFRNPYSHPVKIDASVEGDGLYCRILAQKPLEADISIEREVRQVLRPRQVIRSAPGAERPKIVNHGALGMRVAVYRRTVIDGRSTRSLISEDVYPPVNRLLEFSDAP